MPPDSPTTPRPLTLAGVGATWWPLAGSWLLMGLELPAISAVMARLPHATVSLAAYGGVVFPMALLIESPILMLLSASTALARDEHSYRLVRRFMFVAAGLLTLLHAAIAFTPLFDFVVGTLIGVPEPVREPARVGLRILLPWTLSIAYRRTQQGVLIRFGHARAVTWGTMVRLGTNVLVLALGAWLGTLPGIVVGTSAVACGVMAEAAYAGLTVRHVLRTHVLGQVSDGPPLTMLAFLRFYTPLMLTPLINFLAMPLAAAAMSRMPNALESLAAWPVLSGITFTLRSTGFALNEVVVAQMDRWRPVPALRRFTLVLSIVTTLALLAIAATPLAVWWFARVSALSPGLASLAAGALWVMVPMPAISAWQSWYQGALVHSRRTRGVTESVLVLLFVTACVLVVGVAWNVVPGLYVAAAGMVIGGAAQIVWLAWRSRDEIAAVVARDGDAAVAGSHELPPR